MTNFVQGSAKFFLLICAAVLLVACSDREPEDQAVYEAVDDLYGAVAENAQVFEIIAEIDHSRLAAEAGEVMPPARVIIFSDPEINSKILQQEPLAGLDLPFRVLAFAEKGVPGLIATDPDYLKARHGLPESPELQQYEKGVATALGGLPPESVMVLDSSSLEREGGVVKLESEYGFEESIERLKTDILKEGDTIWFGQIDYRAEAEKYGIELPRLTLLLFGAPGPGAKAMADFPRMGLDAFCQKLLVYEQPDGTVETYFNEMPAFAELHYGDHALPHVIINRRMSATLENAVD